MSKSWSSRYLVSCWIVVFFLTMLLSAFLALGLVDVQVALVVLGYFLALFDEWRFLYAPWSMHIFSCLYFFVRNACWKQCWFSDLPSWVSLFAQRQLPLLSSRRAFVMKAPAGVRLMSFSSLRQQDQQQRRPSNHIYVQYILQHSSLVLFNNI